MPKPQPTYTAEFKQEAVQLAQSSNKPKAQIARELGISDSALYSWCKQAAEYGSEAFPGKGHQTPVEEENHRLKRELERVQQERDILKRAKLLRSITANEQQYTVGERSQQQNGVVRLIRI